jgi:hypothetical protein
MAPHAQVAIQRRWCGITNRDDPGLAAFAPADDCYHPVQINVRCLQTHDRGGAGGSVDHESDDGLIPAVTEPGAFTMAYDQVKAVIGMTALSINQRSSLTVIRHE